MITSPLGDRITKTKNSEYIKLNKKQTGLVTRILSEEELCKRTENNNYCKSLQHASDTTINHPGNYIPDSPLTLNVVFNIRLRVPLGFDLSSRGNRPTEAFVTVASGRFG